jgi:hypothetical protein
MSKSAQVTNHNLGEIDLRRLPYSPDKNPLMDPQEVKTRHRRIRSSRGDELMNTATGEISHVSAIHQIEELDESQFVKIFPAGVAAAYGLTKTAQRVFTAVLEQYRRTPMRGGFADYVTLFWFDGGLDGHAIGMSERTFRRGLKELLAKRFLYPRRADEYWTNPALFFKGDRVLFVREYRMKSTAEKLPPAAPEPTPKPGQIERDPNTGDMFGG